ncbi:MAG: polysulfide reductase NrfD, partial [Pirellulaceae bacterium]|nr:polysulfide reductase NrfD [Pirellulaceae bacterium]
MQETPFVFPNDPHVTWSIMIVLYPYITGLVAGAFVVSSLYHVFDKQVLKPVARLALVTSLCFCAFATLPLLLHLHHPERAFNIMFTPSATSAMAGFGFIYNLYMLLLVVEVWLVFR